MGAVRVLLLIAVLFVYLVEADQREQASKRRRNKKIAEWTRLLEDMVQETEKKREHKSSTQQIKEPVSKKQESTSKKTKYENQLEESASKKKEYDNQIRKSAGEKQEYAKVLMLPDAQSTAEERDRENLQENMSQELKERGTNNNNNNNNDPKPPPEEQTTSDTAQDSLDQCLQLPSTCSASTSRRTDVVLIAAVVTSLFAVVVIVVMGAYIYGRVTNNNAKTELSNEADDNNFKWRELENFQKSKSSKNGKTDSYVDMNLNRELYPQADDGAEEINDAYVPPMDMSDNRKQDPHYVNTEPTYLDVLE